MKFKLALALLVAVITIGLGVSAFAESTDTSGTISVTTTDVLKDGFDISKLNIGASESWVFGVHGKPEFVTLLSFQIASYSRKTADNAYQEIASLRYETDVPFVGDYHYGVVNGKLVPFTKLLQKAAGKDGLIKFDFLNAIVDKADLEAGIGIGHSEKHGFSGKLQLLLIQTKF